MKRYAQKSDRAHAFTLVEVLVALAIFALAGIVLARAYANVLNAQHSAFSRNTTASALTMVREALFAETTLENVEKWNDFKLPDDGEAKWRAVVLPTNVADLFDVTLEAEIRPSRENERYTVSESFRLLRPTWSQPQDRETLRAEARTKLAERTFK